MKIRRCLECKHCLRDDRWGYPLCTHPDVNSNNPGYLGGLDHQAIQCNVARSRSLFAKCGLAGKLWEQAKPKVDEELDVDFEALDWAIGDSL